MSEENKIRDDFEKVKNDEYHLLNKWKKIKNRDNRLKIFRKLRRTKFSPQAGNYSYARKYFA